MRKLKSLYYLLCGISGGRWIITLISAVLPVLITLGFGLFLAIKYAYIVELSVSIMLSTLCLIIPLIVLNRRSKKLVVEAVKDHLGDLEEGLVRASSDWSQAELGIFRHAQIDARRLIERNSDWSNLDKAGLEILERVADQFGKKTLDFSIPEGLQLFEEISRRYKLVVEENIPGIEYLKVSYIKAGYQAYEKYGEIGQKIINVAIWANHAKNLYYNPIKVISDLASQKASASMNKSIVDGMQLKAKAAFLDEVAAVAIDLYSGRFSLEDIQVSNVSHTDQQLSATELEPIRIVVAGQTGCGKSSLVNVLKDEWVAEVDMLPSTEAKTVYSATVDNNQVRVVELPGLDGRDKTAEQMLFEITCADLILWVVKANQPARGLDKQLHDKFELFYSDPKNISRIKPTIILVVNQVDNLKPVALWQPPYDLDNPVTEKAKIICQAVSYNQNILNVELALALSIATDKPHFGVDSFKKILIEQISQANNIQRNRQRVEAIQRGSSVKKQLTRAFNASKKIVPAALGVASPKLAEIAAKKIIKKAE